MLKERLTVTGFERGETGFAIWWDYTVRNWKRSGPCHWFWKSRSESWLAQAKVGCRRGKWLNNLRPWRRQGILLIKLSMRRRESWKNMKLLWWGGTSSKDGSVSRKTGNASRKLEFNKEGTACSWKDKRNDLKCKGKSDILYNIQH